MNRGLVQGVGFVLFVVCTVVFLSYARQQSDRTGATADGGYPVIGRQEIALERLRYELLRWTTTTNHREIGLLYIGLGTIAALWGGFDAMMMRTHLLTPAADLWTEQTYNELFTMHGITMLIFFVGPVFFGLGNYFLPLLLDADDMAFPRLNAVGFWMLPPALLLARAGIIAEVTSAMLSLVVPEEFLSFLLVLREPALGWTLYPPLSAASPDPQIDFLLLGLHLSGIATTIAVLNFIVTIVYERGENVGWASLDIFSWNMLVTSGIALFAFPLLGSAIVMLLLDRNLGTTFFAIDGGGPVLWQHLFWFWGHPEVYIVFLPATGLMSLILPKFVGRHLFGFKFIVYSTFAIGILSFGVWAHHMFVTGMDPRVRASFMATSIAIAVPSAIKVFNWITTIWNGDVKLAAPTILSVGSIGLFIVGGVTGVFLAVIPIDVIYHGTYYVVGHFHLIIMGIIPLMMFAASYYWYPLLTSRMYDRRLALFQSVLLVAGSGLTFMTLLVLGFLELPRRYATYPAEYASIQVVASIGAYIIGLSVLMWLYNMLWSYWNGRPVESADPWNLKRTGQFTREWQWFEDRLEREKGIPPTEPETVRPSYSPRTEEGRPAFFYRIRQTGETFLRDAVRGAIGGFIGTLLMSGVLFAAVILGLFDLTGFAELAELTGLPASVGLGYLVFLLGGMTTWALLFLTFAEYLPGELSLVSGLWYATIVSFGFLIAFYTGQTGLELVGYIVFSVVAHWMYGLGLAGTIEFLEGRRPAPPSEAEG